MSDTISPHEADDGNPHQRIWPRALAFVAVCVAALAVAATREHAGIIRNSPAFNTIERLSVLYTGARLFPLVRRSKRRHISTSQNLASRQQDGSPGPNPPRSQIKLLALGTALVLIFIASSFPYRDGSVDAIFSICEISALGVTIVALAITGNNIRDWKLYTTYYGFLLCVGLCCNFALVPFREPQSSQARASLQVTMADLQTIYRSYRRPD
jgi:hypothetical protein